MPVISLVTGKGGVGKSTLSFNLAGALAELNKKVILIDADNEKPDSLGIYAQSIDDNLIDYFQSVIANKEPFSNKSKGNIAFDIVLSKQNDLRNQISDLSNSYDYVIIDTPPNYSASAVKSVVLSDLSLIVAAPSFSDENAVGRTFDAIDMGKPIFGIMNKIIKAQKLSKRLFNVITDSERPFLNTYISDKVSIKESAYAGLYVGDYEPNAKSHKEFEKLANEILEYFNK
jgi:cellulose biosynthesis protein BcsQ